MLYLLSITACNGCFAVLSSFAHHGLLKILRFKIMSAKILCIAMKGQCSGCLSRSVHVVLFNIVVFFFKLGKAQLNNLCDSLVKYAVCLYVPLFLKRCLL